MPDEPKPILVVTGVDPADLEIARAMRANYSRPDVQASGDIVAAVEEVQRMSRWQISRLAATWPQTMIHRLPLTRGERAYLAGRREHGRANRPAGRRTAAAASHGPPDRPRPTDEDEPPPLRRLWRALRRLIGGQS